MQTIHLHCRLATVAPAEAYHRTLSLGRLLNSTLVFASCIPPRYLTVAWTSGCTIDNRRDGKTSSPLLCSSKRPAPMSLLNRSGHGSMWGLDEDSDHFARWQAEAAAGVVGGSSLLGRLEEAWRTCVVVFFFFWSFACSRAQVTLTNYSTRSLSSCSCIRTVIYLA